MEKGKTMRLIDAEPIEIRYNTEALGRREMYEMVKTAPTIDAVQVVRCKDCMFAEQNVTISHSDSDDYTVTLCFVDIIPKIVDNYYFCAGGESKRERKYNG